LRLGGDNKQYQKIQASQWKRRFAIVVAVVVVAMFVAHGAAAVHDTARRHTLAHERVTKYVVAFPAAKLRSIVSLFFGLVIFVIIRLCHQVL